MLCLIMILLRQNFALGFSPSHKLLDRCVGTLEFECKKFELTSSNDDSKIFAFVARNKIGETIIVQNLNFNYHENFFPPRSIDSICTINNKNPPVSINKDENLDIYCILGFGNETPKLLSGERLRFNMNATYSKENSKVQDTLIFDIFVTLDNKKLQQEKNQKRIVFILTVIFLISILFILVYKYKKQKNK